ncbi:type II toxin-antitoxin system PemK/MazF family toxin [Candidatus Kaiserbacteria bacterium]|nr:type II toxin-antitoxin system PemK/MazF family toxin [Candidatus Kaiserbacteria bacterium]
MKKKLYTKAFDAWNSAKKIVDASNRQVFGYPREVWWCSLGVNVGAEIDGRNENFERTIIIIRVYNKETMLVLPITGKARSDKFHLPIAIDAQNPETKESYKKTVYVKLTQARVISNKRLIRKVDVMDEESFEKIKNAFRDFT